MKASLIIGTALRNRKTYLQHCFYTQPFKVLPLPEEGDEKRLHLMLLSSSPGILEGDAHDISITIAAGCSLQLHTQSYQRLFAMKNGAAQNVEVRLEKEASFYFLPNPTVPHEASRFKVANSLYLSDKSTLVWGEVLTPGRMVNGEAFRFSSYHNCTQLFLKGKLVLKENLLLQPLVNNAGRIGQWEGYTHQATLIYVKETIDPLPLIDELHEWLSARENICFGITALPVPGFLLKILGYKGEQLYRCLQEIGDRFLIQKDKPLSTKAEAYAA